MLEIHTDDSRFAKFFLLEHRDTVTAALAQAMEAIPGAYGMILSSIDGQRLAHVTGKPLNTSRLSAITGSFCGLGETLGNELGQKDFRDVIVQTTTGIAVSLRIPAGGGRMILLAAASNESNIGIVSSQARFCAQRLAELCFTR